MTTSNEGPYEYVHVETIAGDLHALYIGNTWRRDFKTRLEAESWGEYIRSAYVAGHVEGHAAGHRAALASVAGEVRELVEAAHRILNTNDEASAKEALHLALSAPAIAALISGTKGNA